MTQREREILNYIAQNPMITHQELAEKTGCSKASVAVHISTLTKTGYLAGKGYVLRSPSYAVVVGGVNMDIGGRSDQPLVAGDSNPGKVRMSLGGVGRNIAHNMALLDCDVRLLTALGDDLYAQRIAASCAELGIDISQARTVAGGATSTYLFLSGPDGDMALAVSDMDICEHITPAYLQSRRSLLDNAQVVVLDTNIPEASIHWLCENVKAPIFADPVSTAKAVKLAPVLGRIHTLKPKDGGRPAQRRPHHRPAQPGKGRPGPAGHRPKAGVHLPGQRGGLRRRPQRGGVSALPAGPHGQRHRGGGRLYGRPGLGLPGGHRPCRDRPPGPRGRRHRH